MDEEDIPLHIAEAQRRATEAEERQKQKNEEEPPDVLYEHTQTAKVYFWGSLAGWCGFFLFQWFGDFSGYEFLKGVFPQGVFFLWGIIGTPIFIWYFLPIRVLKLPIRFQFAGQLVAASITGFLPLALFIFVFGGPSFIVTPNIAEAKDHFVILIFLSFIIIYISRILGGLFPWQFSPPMRQILSIRAYMIASGISFLLVIGFDNPARGFTYLFLIVSSYLGITIGFIEQRFGFVQRREARALQRHFEKAEKQAKKNTQNISREPKHK